MNYIYIDQNDICWRDLEIRDIKPIYEISEYGDVKNKKSGRILKQRVNDDGYYEIGLMTYSGNVRWMRINILVAHHFIAVEDLDRNQVNHINGIKSNNHYTNLEYNTPKENIHHAISHGLIKVSGEDNGQARLKNSDVIKICEYLSNNMNYTDILNELGLENTRTNRKLLIRIKTRQSWNCISKNYTWSSEKVSRLDYKYSELVITVCELLEKHFTTTQMISELNLTFENKRERKYFIEFVGTIRRKSNWVSVSKNYNF